MATLLTAVASGAAEQLPTAQQLMKTSNAATDLALTGPYRLQATAVVFESGKQTATGHITIDRDGDSVREEISFGDYEETSVVTGGKLFLVRKPAVTLSFVEHIRRLDRLWQVTLPQAVSAGEVRQSHLNDADAYCFNTGVDTDSRAQACFAIAGNFSLSLRTIDAWSSATNLFSDYREFAGKQYPSTVRVLENRNLSVEVRDIQVKAMQFPAGHFAPLDGTAGSPTCRDIRPPHLVHRVEPHYPAAARMAHIQGAAVIVGVISVDGNLTELKAVSGHPILLQETLETVRQWKYAPALCPDGPIPAETRIKVEFHM